MSVVNKRPWYREPLVWMVIAIPMSAVIAGMVMIYLAVDSDDGLVTDDYYKVGKEINLVVARDRAAVDYGLDAQLALLEDESQVVLNVQGKPEWSLPEHIEVRFMHATRPGFDRILLLVRGDSGEFRAPIPDLVIGKWHVQLAADDWRLLGAMNYPDEQQLSIKTEAVIPET
ncbi:MAG: FixH family protein [bacterium]